MTSPLLAPAAQTHSRSGTGTFGIAYTSFPIRTRQARQQASGSGPALPAEKFIDLCHAFGGSGCQMDIAQLHSSDAEYLKGLRRKLDEKKLFLEFSISARMLEDATDFARAAAASRALGVSRLRVALLSGRRYEDFKEMGKWKEFAAHWKKTLNHSAAMLERYKLQVGVENHKDWLAVELIEILRAISSPYLGACVDFGNNLALLEDPLSTAEILGPFAVTTHLKDMALRPCEKGFELSEVPLGQGMLPLGRIVALLRKSRPDLHFCLEMITRDPLKVLYREESYWATYEKRDAARIMNFENHILKMAATGPLPRISELDEAGKLAREDENVRRCAAYARGNLGL